MDKKIVREKDARHLVDEALDKVCLPVIETIGPKGQDVLYERENGDFEITNDGITIIRNIDLKDPIDNAVAELVKSASLRTNQEVGDASSTTILWTYTLIKEFRRLQAEGMFHKDISALMEKIAKKLLTRLEKSKKVVKDSHTKHEVARISANNDKEVADFVVDAIDTAGLDGMIYLEFSGNDKTRLEKQIGFRIPAGMMYQNLYTDPARPIMAYQDIPVIILDKKIYYAEDAEHILRTAIDAGYKEVCLVAKDFMGDALNTFIANHVQGTIRVVLAKLDDDTQLEDLATYLNAKIVSEAGGRRVDSITKEDFNKARGVSADPQKILFTNYEDNQVLKDKIAYLKEELAKDKDNPALKTRLASLTSGIVTIKVGGRTQPEARERVFRYEDAINATRAAMRDGYLVGGGLSIWAAFDPKDYDSTEEAEVALSLTQSSIIRIAKNAQIRLDWKQIKKDVGLNALTGKYENLLESGVVEPFKATEMALKNAVSVATMISSIGTFIFNEYDESDKSTKGD